MNRRSKQRKLAAEEAKPQTDSRVSGRLILAAAIVSTVGLLVVFFQSYPNQVVESSPRNMEPSSEALEADQGSENQGKDTNAAQAWVLPTQAIDFDTESEQKEMLAAVEEAIAKFPQDAEVFHIAALAYAELLQTERALELFERSIELDGRNPAVLVSYADVLLQVGRQTAAVAILEKSVKQGVETAPLLTALGEAYSQLGEVELSAETLRRAVVRFPNHGPLLMGLAQAEVQLEEFAQAEQHARLAIELGQVDRAIYLALTTALIRQGKRDEALAIRSNMPVIEPQSVPDDNRYKQSFREFASNAYSLLAVVYSAHRALAEAESKLLHAIALEPTSVKALTALGDLFYRGQRIDESLAVQRRLIDVQPANIVNYANYASLAISAGDVGLAETVLRRAAEVDASGESNLMLARFLLGVGKFADAATHGQIAVSRLANVDAYLVWIAALRAQGETASALNALLKAKQLAPNDSRLAEIQL